MTTTDENIRENEGYNKGNRQALMTVLTNTAAEAIRRYAMNPTVIGYREAIEGALYYAMTKIDAGAGIDFLSIIRENCAHTWLSPLAYSFSHICQQCGEIEPIR